MAMRIGIIGVAVAVATIGSAALAADRNAARAIAAGDYVQAERMLQAERRIFPKRAELMLNLAAVYRQTGRDADARALYADVLKRDSVEMDLLDERTVSSHTIAAKGLARLSQVAAK
jgi:thioredoxin-like negative regulator of GroEL